MAALNGNEIAAGSLYTIVGIVSLARLTLVHEWTPINKKRVFYIQLSLFCVVRALVTFIEPFLKYATRLVLSRLALFLFFSLFSFVVFQWADVVNPKFTARHARLWWLYGILNAIFFVSLVLVTVICVVSNAIDSPVMELPISMLCFGSLAVLVGFVWFGWRLRKRAGELPPVARARFNRVLRLLTGVIVLCSILFIVQFNLLMFALYFNKTRGGSVESAFQGPQCLKEDALCIWVGLWLPELVPCACMLLLMWERDLSSQRADVIRKLSERFFGTKDRMNTPLLRPSGHSSDSYNTLRQHASNAALSDTENSLSLSHTPYMPPDVPATEPGTAPGPQALIRRGSEARRPPGVFGRTHSIDMGNIDEDVVQVCFSCQLMDFNLPEGNRCCFLTLESSALPPKDLNGMSDGIKSPSHLVDFIEGNGVTAGRTEVVTVADLDAIESPVPMTATRANRDAAFSVLLRVECPIESSKAVHPLDSGMLSLTDLSFLTPHTSPTPAPPARLTRRQSVGAGWMARSPPPPPPLDSKSSRTNSITAAVTVSDDGGYIQVGNVRLKNSLLRFKAYAAPDESVEDVLCVLEVATLPKEGSTPQSPSPQRTGLDLTHSMDAKTDHEPLERPVRHTSEPALVPDPDALQQVYLGHVLCLASTLLTHGDGRIQLELKSSSNRTVGALEVQVAALRRGKPAHCKRRLSKWYGFRTQGDKRLLVEEDLLESQYAFDVPAKLIRILLTDREAELSAAEKDLAEYDRQLATLQGDLQDREHSAIMGDLAVFSDLVGYLREAEEIRLAKAWLAARVDTLRAHVDLLRRSAHTGEGGKGHEGHTFKSSQQKKDPNMQFVATNLHVQELRVRELDSSSAYHFVLDDAAVLHQSSANMVARHAEEPESVYDTVTVGAFSAHVRGFKAGGIRQLRDSLGQATAQTGTLRRAKSLLSVNQSRRAEQELRLEIQIREDIVMCQAASALVTSFSRTLRLLQQQSIMEASRVLEMYAQCGYLFGMESLLSTAGQELGMLGDFYAGVQLLSRFAFRLVPPRPDSTKGGHVRISRENGIYVVEMRLWPMTGLKGAHRPPPPSATRRPRVTVLRQSRPTVTVPASDDDFDPIQHASDTSADESMTTDSDSDIEGFLSQSVDSRSSMGSGPAVGRGRGGPDIPPQILQLLPRSLLEGGLIPVHPVIFTQGINEMQTMANMNPMNRAVNEQGEINRESFQVLRRYADSYISFLRKTSAGKSDGKVDTQRMASTAAARAVSTNTTDTDLDKLESGSLVSHTPKPTHHRAASTGRRSAPQLSLPPSSIAVRRALFSTWPSEDVVADYLSSLEFCVFQNHREKNVQLLQRAADIVRMLHGGRATACKSAKDRTGMSVTLEQARILELTHDLAPEDVGRVTELMRRHGVRRMNAEKNVGQAKFAFNPLQNMLLPAEYRPPRGTTGKCAT